MTQTLYEEYKFYWINEFKNTPNDKPFNPALIADRFISDRSEKYINKEELKEKVILIFKKMLDDKIITDDNFLIYNEFKCEILKLLESDKK